jgi:hypothetical protein
MALLMGWPPHAFPGARWKRRWLREERRIALPWHQHRQVSRGSHGLLNLQRNARKQKSLSGRARIASALSVVCTLHRHSSRDTCTVAAGEKATRRHVVSSDTRHVSRAHGLTPDGCDETTVPMRRSVRKKRTLGECRSLSGGEPSPGCRRARGRPRPLPSPLPSSSSWEPWLEEEARPGLMRCSKMAMRRNRETRTAVAAKPKEMALAFEGASASLASGCDGVSAPAIPTHGWDLGPANPLMACLATRGSWILQLLSIGTCKPEQRKRRHQRRFRAPYLLVLLCACEAL